MKRAKFTNRANLNLVDIARYIALESRSLRTARLFTTAIMARCHKLASLRGTLGRSRDELEPGLRSVAFKSYMIFFRYVGGAVQIVTILHGMRDIDTVFNDE